MITSLASEGTFLGVGNHIAAKHAVKGLVQTAGELAVTRKSRIERVANEDLKSYRERAQEHPHQCSRSVLCVRSDDDQVPRRDSRAQIFTARRPSHATTS